MNVFYSATKLTITFNCIKDIATCMSTGTGSVSYHLISHMESSCWETLADIHTGPAALHMLACCPHNLFAIWLGTSLSLLHLWHISIPLTMCDQCVHLCVRACVCVTFLENIKQLTQVRIKPMETQPTPTLFTGLEMGWFSVFVNNVLVCMHHANKRTHSGD